MSQISGSVRKICHLLAGVALAIGGAAAAAAPDPKPRVLVLTDIGNEPDDSESFVRLLLYANEFDIEGLVAVTSTWQRTRVQPQLLNERIDGYAQVLANLRRHADGYPAPAALKAVVRAGVADYGMRAVGDGKDTDGSRRIIEVVDRPDPRPIYIPMWGGAADLAQALWTVRRTRTPAQVDAFVAKIRAYSISDQDDCGPWIRRNFPDLFWIASVHGWGQYGLAAWTGISGDLFLEQKWPAAETVTNAWLETHIRRGALGRLYPPHAFIMEGDTPSFLGLIRNGLNDPEHPEWGGWGGRYLPVYEGAGHRADAQDLYADPSGKSWMSSQATIFRWRPAFQNDFVARIAWTLSPEVKRANHNPEVVLNGERGLAPVMISVKSGATVRLSAAGTRDRDGDRLTYRWWQYAEPSGAPGIPTPKLVIAGADTPEAQFSVPAFKIAAANVPVPSTPLAYHVILEVTDSGEPALTSYRRAIISVLP
ncbi:DUF1593 domain-containing protein [Sphingomonas sp. MMSM20]|uniref:DUF1593 domain-containing protein n=1 Tax=Sphingomonas lycopersici TaxID=2951807 RepID=UPI002238FCBB|nr:DUF1593 domain-containing protein [Sphingomonas lycopersici]MCW6530476.1 DUF1593 domain-containing protein [Sphingomonas lycopersici]